MQTTQPQMQVFRPRFVYLALPFAVTVIAIVAIGWFSPPVLLFALPLFAVVLTIGATSNSGLILSHEGIEWYAVTPRWRFRKIPWKAVRSARLGFFGFGRTYFGPIILTVELDRYEWWAWGTPRRDKCLTIEIFRRYLVRHDEIWDAIQHWLQYRDREAAAGITDARAL